MICENCGKEHDGSYGSGRFCSKKCAKSFSTKNIIKNELKKAKCISCGEDIYINKRASDKTCKCDKCRGYSLIISNDTHHKYKQLKYTTCKICGRQKNEMNECENDFCKQHNYQHFKNLIKYFGFDETKFGTPEVEEEFNRVRNMLYDLYWNQNLSSTEIARKFNYTSTPTNITQKFFKNYLHIPVKTVAYSVKENFLEGREVIGEIYNQYKAQWHTTWNNKEVFLRSSYELDYAKELDNQKIDYDVEALRIKYYDSYIKDFRCAVPDFYIPLENMIVEIKSLFTLDIQNMKDKIKAYKDLGYNFKLICDHKEIEI